MRRTSLSLLGEFSLQGGHCYVADLPANVPYGDDLTDNMRSDLRLFEDEREIGPAHALHKTIRATGGGAFSHWNSQLLFSSSDGTDPRRNGRTYRYLWGDGAEGPRARALRLARDVGETELDAEERYAAGERLFGAFVPNERLSERNRSMFSDLEFRADYERFDRLNYRSFDRKFALREFAKLAVRWPGDFVECGVFKGASAYLLAKVIAAHASEKRLYLFDSFAGLSQPGPHDGSHWRAGALAGSVEEVAKNLAPFADTVVFHPGWIPERFREVESRSFALVHIDVDLYEPTRACLDFFVTRMTPRGVIVCDDYGFDTCPGARRAVDEIAALHRLPVVHLPTGQGVLFSCGTGTAFD